MVFLWFCPQIGVILGMLAYIYDPDRADLSPGGPRQFILLITLLWLPALLKRDD